MRRQFILLLIIFGFIQGQQRSSSSNNVSVLRDLEFEQIKLSYIQTDRALAVLKTVGYAVVEFRATKGEVAGESNFTPVFSNKNTLLLPPYLLILEHLLFLLLFYLLTYIYPYNFVSSV